MTDRFLIDNSAWAHLNHPNLPPKTIEWAAQAFAERRAVVCLPFLLEAGYSARDSADHERIFTTLLDLPRVVIDDHIEQMALDTQRRLANAGHHRLPPPDLIVAAAAGRHGIGVLHYDGDFDVIKERGGLDFTSLWLTERSTL